MSSTSSSTDDEDLSKFASCAVSADQLEKDAQVEAKKRAVRSSQRPISSAARPAAASAQQQQQDGGSDEPVSTGLDLISEKIATALDTILARELDDPASIPPTAGTTTPSDKAAGIKSSKKSAAKAAAAAAAAGEAASTPCATPAQANPAEMADITASPPAAAAAAAAAVTQDADDDCTGVQLFRTVPKGTPCVIQQDSTEVWEPLAAGQDHQQQQQGAATGFGSASLPQKQPLRDLILRLSLAERSRQASKRKYEATLAALAVDGSTLRSAAAAAGYACNSSTGGKNGGSSSSKASTTAAWVKGWKRMKGQKAEGLVVDAKEWVPYDVRAAKLLGTQPIC